MTIKNNNRPKKQLLIIGFIAVVLVVGVLFLLEKKSIINLYKQKMPAATKEDAKTTSPTPTAQEDFQSGDIREPGSTLDENRGSGGIADTSGSLSGIDTTNPVVSATGEISLYVPRKQSTMTSGHTVAGASSLKTVSYRLIDSVSGVIATGELQVINGKFSGKLDFKTSAKEGRLDIYASRMDGTEYSNIEIPLRFE